MHYGFLNATIEYKDNLKKWLNLLKDDDGSSYNDWIRGGEVINIKATENHKSNSNFSTVSGVEFFHDPKNQYSKMLEGKIAPYCLGACGYYDDPANPDRRFITYGPAFRSESNALSRSQTVTGGTTNGSYSPENTLDQLQSVDIILTNDRSKWTRCVVFETGELYGSNVEGARKGNIRKSTSLELVDIDKDAFGNKDGFKESDNINDIGRGWFPGFAINVETGERLNMMFGENSQVTGNYAANMIWDPSSVNLTQFGEPILGGMHFLYVSNTLYDEGVATRDTMVQFFNQYKGNDQILDVFKRVYRNLMYTAVPLMDSRFDIYKRDPKTKEIINYELPTDVKLRIRVRRPLETMATSSSMNYPANRLVYQFSTKGMAPKIDTVETKKSALDLINIVPNPYYAYSNYENDQLSSIVKITNLPNKCQVFIYDINGALVRKFSKDIDETKIDVSDGQSIEVQTDNLDNSIKWDLKNQVGVPIASGLYYIYVKSPGLGERTLKFFGALRPTDVSSF